MGNLKNINLDVASFALECVKNVKLNNENKDKGNSNAELNYKTLVKKMPTLIQKNGLIGTLVFNLSKIDKWYHKEVLINIINWTNENYKISNINEFKDKKINSNNNDNVDIFISYVEWVTSLDQGKYRLLTKEMMNLFSWIKRFADGMFEDNKEEIDEREE